MSKIVNGYTIVFLLMVHQTNESNNCKLKIIPLTMLVKCALPFSQSAGEKSVIIPFTPAIIAKSASRDSSQVSSKLKIKIDNQFLI